MKIGIYNPRVAVSNAGGTETFLRQIIKRLSDTHDIVLYCGDGDILDEVASLSIDINQIPFVDKHSRYNKLLTNWTPMLPAEVESLSMYLNARKQRMFKNIDDTVDVLSTHYYLDNLLVSRSVNVPTLFRFPGIRQPSPRWKAMVRFATPETYLANSRATADRLEEWLALDVDGIVYAGVDLNQFCPDTMAAFEAEKTVVIYVGRLDDGKGLFDLLKAHSEIEDLADLYLVGDGTLRTDLEQEVETLGTADSVTFTGVIPHKHIQEYYAAADVFCLPSYHEGFPIVNMEAMATGCAVVSTRIDSIEEQIVHGKNGLLVEPGDVTALTDTLRQVVTDRELRDDIIAAGLETAPNFSWESQATVMESHYERIAQN